MNRQTHLIIGAVAFLTYQCVIVLFHVTSMELLLPGIVAVAAGSVAPDLLEPPTSAQHRGICHSRRALNSVAVLFLLAAVPVLFAPGMPCFPLVSAASCFFLGCSAHLLADSMTRAGLPR